MTALFVSPHLDDAAWSCAGAIVERLERRERVVVCSVFTQGQAARRREDAAALARFGAEWEHLDMEDERGRPHAPSFRSLVLDPEPSPRCITAIADALRGIVRRVRPDIIFVPLAIGGHVDHRAVFLAARDLPHACCYEDRPYAFVPAFAELRRLELEGGRGTTHDLETEIHRGGCDALFEAHERGSCLADLDDRLRAVHDGLGLRIVDAHTERHDRRRTAAALDLVRAYPSQIAWLRVADRVESIWAPEGELVERTCRVTPVAEC